MISSRTRGLRLALVLLACSGLIATPTGAQAQAPGAAQLPGSSGASGDDPGLRLSENLATLARNPNSVAALTGAGKAALALGDPQAALTFFGRAEELAPRDGEIKAGIGSALVGMEQATAALPVFEEALALGVREAEIAGDRGLAWDLTGEPARAQKDYRLALGRHEDPEIRRRLALSLAIGGNRNAALSAIDEQLRRQDRAAWRARAFILALTGDTEGANQAVQSVMPGQAAAMAPFLAKLPSLSASDRALAVNFGHFPGEEMPVQTASVAPLNPPASDAITGAGRPDAAQPPLGPQAQRAIAAGTGGGAANPAGSAVTAPPSSLPPPAASSPTQVAASAGTKPPPPQEPATTTVRDFADVAALVNALPAAADAIPAEEPDVGKVAAPATRNEDKPAAAKSPSKPTKPGAKPASSVSSDPSRVWVQIAHASTVAALPRQNVIIRRKAPKLFADRSAWTAAGKTTNRLLVGPFKSDKEAQDFVAQLSKADVAGLSWTSPAGQEIKKLPTK